MNRTDFQNLSLARLEDARALLGADRWAGAYYIAGYSVECALKAYIAKQVQAGDYPPRETRDLYVHSLSKLLSVSGLTVPVASENDWRLVLNWTEEIRYGEQNKVKINITESQARDMFQAAEGVTNWLQQIW